MRRSMRLVSPLLIVIALSGCRASGPDPVPAARAVPQYDIKEFLGTTNYTGASFSPDGRKVLVSGDQTGVYNAYAVPAEGGEPVPLTRSATDRIMAQGYFPHDERILYLSDAGGNERTHLFVLPPDGQARDLTPGKEVRAQFHGWAGDGRSFFMSTNERDARFFDVYDVAVDDYRRTLLYRDTSGYDLAAVSPGRRYLAFNKSRTTADGDVHLYDRTSGTMRHLTPHEGEVQNEAQDFDSDDSGLYLLTDEGSEFRHLVRIDLAGGGREIIERPAWDVWYAYLSWSGRYLVVGINEDGRTVVKIHDRGAGGAAGGAVASWRPVALAGLPEGDLSGVRFSRDETRLALYVSSSRSPRDLHVADLAGGGPRRLTRSLSPKIDPADLVDGRVARFRSHDGVEVPGILYRPHRASPRSKAPAVVWVHGGPGGQSRLDYSGLLQYLVNHGYVVFAINNRGSEGYGRTFFKLDDRRHGDADLDDCVASKAFLAATGYVDPERIAIAGGSYGGYMVLAALAFRPEEFALGVDIFGVSNWVRTLSEIPAWWESFRQALYAELGDPARDGEYLRRISPLFHADRIVRPLIVLQGANDPRVQKVESDEIVAAARSRGVPVEYLVFDDEGHGFAKKENQERGYRAILEFLDRHLKGASAGGPAAS